MRPTNHFKTAVYSYDEESIRVHTNANEIIIIIHNQKATANDQKDEVTTKLKIIDISSETKELSALEILDLINIQIKHMTKKMILVLIIILSKRNVNLLKLIMIISYLMMMLNYPKEICIKSFLKCKRTSYLIK